MSDLQHQRLAELSRELRLSAIPDLYSAIAQSAAAKSASFADFLEQILRAERDATGEDPDATSVGDVDTVELSTRMGRLGQVFGGDIEGAGGESLGD